MKKYILILPLMFLCLTAVAQTEAVARCGQIVTLTAQPAEGFFFVRWSDNVTDNPREIEISSETTVTDFVAIFEGKEFTINVRVKEEGTGDVEQTTFTGKAGEPITLDAIESDPCYQFDHWEDASGTSLSTSKTFAYTILGETTVYAVFVDREFKIKATADHGTVDIQVQ
ncbi:MAG: hypothetical protein K5660_05635 [Paludibacteraceae bacterium]|nr:hypothetical protein [Paludibacteraceae bacterium]